MEKRHGVIELGDNPVICQKWEESERGWGTRPDGFSLHVSREALTKFIREIYEPRQKETVIPDEYDRPDGTPYDINVSDEVYADLVANGGSRRYYRHNYTTPAGGIDGWLPYDLNKLREEGAE